MGLPAVLLVVPGGSLLVLPVRSGARSLLAEMAALAGMRCALGVASTAPSAASQQARRVSRSPVDCHSGVARFARRFTSMSSATGGSKRVPFVVAASSGPISPGDGLEAYNEQLRRAANAPVWNSPSKSPAYTSADNVGSYSAPPPQTPSVARDTQKEQVQDSLESISEQAGQAASSAADAVQGGASRVGEQVRQEARYGDDALESAQRVGEAVQEQAGNVGDEVGEQARRVARLGREGVQEALDDPQAAAESAQQNLQGLVAEGAERADAVAQQVQSGGRKVQASAEEASERLQNAASRAFDRSSRAGEDVQSVMAEAAAESGAALEDVGQALRETGEDIAEEIVGKDVMDSFKQTAESFGLRGPDSSEGSAEGSMRSSMSSPRETQETGPEPERTTRIQGDDLVEVYKPPGSKVNVEKEGEGGPGGEYKGLKVLVVGASGRTGRMVVENLVAKGVPVRAVATNVTRQRYLRQLQGVELVEADLTRYETLKRAIGDCNAIICAIGYRPSPLDPFGPYKVEYEGVANLVSAAKNNGNIDKFVFVTSIGVSNLLNPLNLFGGITFWKRQAELYLQRSGLTYTIVRPGGLKSETSKNASVVLKRADSQFIGAITRGQVAEVCVEALVLDKASDKIVEAVEQEMAPSRTLAELFESVA
eukprot:SM000080S22939  [mRNA]  locus=s80:187491:192273:- [translate_table: standard]